MDLLAFFSKSSSSSLHVDYFNKGHAIIATSVLAEVGRERERLWGARKDWNVFGSLFEEESRGSGASERNETGRVGRSNQ